MACNRFFFKKTLFILATMVYSLVAVAAQQYSVFDKKIAQVKKELSFVNQHLQVGTSFYGFDKQNFIEYGYGSCTDFVELLKDQLASIGVASRRVGLISTQGGGHDLLEVRLGKQWILVDPMNGVIYKYSFFQILRHPELADEKIVNNLAAPAPNLLIPGFFSSGLAVHMGAFYFSDPYRFIEPKNSQNQGYFEYTCPKTQCEWTIPLLSTLAVDPVFKGLPLVKFHVTTGFGVSFESMNQKIDLQLGSELSWLIKPQNNMLKFASLGIGPHSFRMSFLSSPIRDISSFQMRVAKPSVLIFRDGVLNFYGANFVCDKHSLWSQDSLEEQGEFYNAFFIPRDKNENSAWTPLVWKENVKYRTTVLNLPSNEPRIRFQPYVIHKKNSVCELIVHYNTQTVASLLLYTEKNNQLFELGKLPPCGKEICEFIHRFTQKELFHIS